MSKARLRWQCRRGMRELDVLLSQWLEDHYDSAGASRKAAFEALLDLSDPQLAAYLLRGEPAADSTTRDLVAQIRGDAPS